MSYSKIHLLIWWLFCYCEIVFFTERPLVTNHITYDCDRLRMSTIDLSQCPVAITSKPKGSCSILLVGWHKMTYIACKWPNFQYDYFQINIFELSFYNIRNRINILHRYLQNLGFKHKKIFAWKKWKQFRRPVYTYIFNCLRFLQNQFIIVITNLDIHTHLKYLKFRKFWNKNLSLWKVI